MLHPTKIKAGKTKILQPTEIQNKLLNMEM